MIGESRIVDEREQENGPSNASLPARTLEQRMGPYSRAMTIMSIAVMLSTAFYGLASASLPYYVQVNYSDLLKFQDDFEDNDISDWTTYNSPDPHYFGLNDFVDTAAYIRPNIDPYLEPREDSQYMVRMASPSDLSGHAWGESPAYTISPTLDYYVSFRFFVPSYENGWFTVFRDSCMWLTIENETTLAVASHNQVVEVAENLNPGEWYRIEARADRDDVDYDVLVNGEYKATYSCDWMQPPPTGHFWLGDRYSENTISYGEAFWDDFFIGEMYDLWWVDDLNDGNVDDWTTVTNTPGSIDTYFGPSPDPMGMHQTSLRMYYRPWFPMPAPEAVARGASPFHSLPDSTGSYVVSFWFMLVESNYAWITAYDDGRVWLFVDSTRTLKVLIDDDESYAVSQLDPYVWNHIMCRVVGDSGDYDLYLDGQYVDTYEFTRGYSFYRGGFPHNISRPTPPRTIYMGANSTNPSSSAEAFWDDFRIDFDTDGDGIGDWEETVGWFGAVTDPDQYDTDGDYLGDGIEQGLRGLDHDPSETTDPNDADTDDDGIWDGSEDRDKDGVWDVTYVQFECNPNSLDSDGDLLTDGQESGLSWPEGYDSYEEWLADPTSDTDLVYFKVDGDGGATTTAPWNPDTDTDGLPDGWIDGWIDDNGFYDFGEFEDLDLDGMIDTGEYGNTPGSGETDPNTDDTDEDGLQEYEESVGMISNPIKLDTDDDSMPDGWEISVGLNPKVHDSGGNPDGDLLSNSNEYTEGTDPFNQDTDSDLLLDGDDPDNLEFNVKDTPGNVFGDVDVLSRTTVIVDGHNYEIGYAIDYATDSSEELVISESSIGDGNLNSVVAKFSFSTAYPLSYSAAIKIKYDEQALDDIDERHLLMYYYIGEIGSEPHWTLSIHPALDEATGRDPDNDVVWVETRRLGSFAIVDSTQNNLNPEVDDNSDGEQLNVVDYDPIITSLCDSSDFWDCIIDDGDLDGDEQADEDHEKTEWTLDFGSGGSITLYARIWLEEGSREITIEHILDPGDPEYPSPRLHAEGIYGVDPLAFDEFTGDGADPSDMVLVGQIEEDYYLAQSFKPPKTLDLGAVEFWVFAQNTVEECLFVEIRTDDQNGKPSSSILASRCFSEDEVFHPPILQDWARWDLGNELVLESDTHWIAMNCPDCPPEEDNANWRGYDGDYHTTRVAAESSDAGSSWTLLQDDDQDIDLLFRAYEKSYPTNPELNVKSATEDPTIDWQKTGTFDYAETISDVLPDVHIQNDIDTFLAQYQSFCYPGYCTEPSGYVMLPFEFYSDSPGKLTISDIHIEVGADVSSPDDVLERDSDSDGISDDIEESFFCTLADNHDTDGDGLWDGEEIRVYGTDPCDPDIDMDDLEDDEEIVWKTDPYIPDTDGDGRSDGEEVKVEPTSDPLLPDTDNDGWNDGDDPSPQEGNPLPWWGFTWHYRRSWISPYCNPTKQNNYCVDAEFQHIWDYSLKPTHARIIRNDIDVMKSIKNSQLTKYGRAEVKRFTNLAIWAEANDALLLPILGGTGDWCMKFNLQDPGCHKDIWYINKVKIFVEELVGSIIEAQSSAYERIVAYQVENEMNHDIAFLGEAGHHDNWNEEWEINLLSKGSQAISQGEDLGGVTDPNLKRPIMMNVNYDLIVSGTWTDNYARLKEYINKVLDEPESHIDIIGLDYYPGTWTWFTDEEDLKDVVESLCNDFGIGAKGKRILVAETGFSSWGGRENDQENYYETLTGKLKSYYNSEGESKGFLGVAWYQLFSEDGGSLPEYSFGVIKDKNDKGSSNPIFKKPAWWWLVEDLTP